MVARRPDTEASTAELATMARLRSQTHARRVRWLSHNPGACTPRLVTLLAADVTALTRVHLARAASLAETLAWLMGRVRDTGAGGGRGGGRGHIAVLEGRYKHALTYYNRAISGFARTRQRFEVAVTRSGGPIQALIYLGRYREAFAYANSARRVFLAAGDHLRLAKLDSNIGNILHRHDRFEEALARYATALDAFVRSGHAKDEAIVLRNMAVCYIGLNRFTPAMHTYERARARAVEQGLMGLVAEVDYNIAYLFYLRGEYHRAIRLYDQARARCEAVQDPYHAALCDLDQAELALELNLLKEGSALASSAYQRFASLGMAYERAKAQVNQGIAAQRRGLWSEAARHYRHARALFAREGNAAWTTQLDVYLAFVLVEQSRPAEAEDLGKTALRRLSRMPFADRRALAHYVLARATSSLGKLAAAKRHCRRALDSLQNHPVPALAYRVWHLLGQMETRTGNGRDAIRAFEQAHVQVEALRGHLGSDRLKIAFLVDKLAVYESLVRVTLQGGLPNLESAFRYMEQAKARTLVERMSTHRSNPTHADATDAAQQALMAAYRRREEPQSGGRRHPTGTLTAREAAVVERDLRRLAAREAAGVSAERKASRALGSLAAVQATIAGDTRVVEYYVAEGRLLGWVIGPRHAAVHDLGPLDVVVRALRFLQFQLAHCRWHWPHRAPDPRPALAHLRTLYNLLVEPLERHLEGTAHVVFVPHGPLHSVPFAALRDGHGCIDDRFTTSVAPSGAVYAQVLRRRPSRAAHTLVVGLADPEAPHIADEVRDVATAFANPTVIEGHAATKNVFGRAATRARILHLATHGHFRSDNPDYSSIQLMDGPLTLLDLGALDLDADLVTLSGCGTGRLVVSGGDEILGLSRGLLGAGARSLLVALWDVSDAGTAQFMKAFYLSLAEGLSRAQSVREATSAVRAAYEHPYFWAPFVLVGDHRELPLSSQGIFSGTHPHS